MSTPWSPATKALSSDHRQDTTNMAEAENENSSCSSSSQPKPPSAESPAMRNFCTILNLPRSTLGATPSDQAIKLALFLLGRSVLLSLSSTDEFFALDALK